MPRPSRLCSCLPDPRLPRRCSAFHKIPALRPLRNPSRRGTSPCSARACRAPFWSYWTRSDPRLPPTTASLIYSTSDLQTKSFRPFVVFLFLARLRRRVSLYVRCSSLFCSADTASWRPCCIFCAGRRASVSWLATGRCPALPCPACCWRLGYCLHVFLVELCGFGMVLYADLIGMVFLPCPLGSPLDHLCYLERSHLPSNESFKPILVWILFL